MGLCFLLRAPFLHRFVPRVAALASRLETATLGISGCFEDGARSQVSVAGYDILLLCEHCIVLFGSHGVGRQPQIRNVWTLGAFRCGDILACQAQPRCWSV